MHSANGDTLEGSFLNVADAGPKVGSITFAATLSFALASAIGLLLIVVAAQPMGAQDEGVIYNFPGYSNGQTPQASMILDNKGNLYGTTTQGGVHGYGAVFEVIVAGNKGPRERVLHSFSINSNPVSSLVFDGMGNFYGTTVGGGKVNEYCPQGCGVVFELTTGGKYTVLYKFKGGFDGANPYGGLAIDSMGNLYGTTRNGGMGGPQYDCGTEFELSAGVETILYAFSGSDGCYPTAGLVTDGYGNLYGTTPQGGAGYGTVFESDTFGDLTTLHYFAGGSDGAYPLSSLVLDDSGFVYGTTQQGGGADCGGTGCGTVYEVDPTIPKETRLYSFMGGSDGAYPYSALAISGYTLYGTTYSGGGAAGNGTVFEVQGTTETVLYRFDGSPDGINPVGGVVFGTDGHLYGTTTAGGTANRGTVYYVVPED